MPESKLKPCPMLRIREMINHFPREQESDEKLGIIGNEKIYGLLWKEIDKAITETLEIWHSMRFCTCTERKGE